MRCSAGEWGDGSPKFVNKTLLISIGEESAGNPPERHAGELMLPYTGVVFMQFGWEIWAGVFPSTVFSISVISH